MTTPMTDRELMQQALDALTTYDGTNGESKRKRVLAALRERLAQPDHHDPIGDAQDKLIAEQVASQDYRTRYDRGCYKCGSHYCPADCPEPTHLVPQQPQMQPCAGRNCGSTNPNLHSAECFEDYEKSTGMEQPEQEPVAWMHNVIEGNVITHIPADIGRHPERWTALYKDPTPCKTCESLAMAVMNDQTYHEKVIPKREWVGLTDEEIDYQAKKDDHAVYFALGALWAEAKLKEKNHG